MKKNYKKILVIIMVIAAGITAPRVFAAKVSITHPVRNYGVHFPGHLQLRGVITAVGTDSVTISSHSYQPGENSTVTVIGVNQKTIIDGVSKRIALDELVVGQRIVIQLDPLVSASAVAKHIQVIGQNLQHKVTRG